MSRYIKIYKDIYNNIIFINIIQFYSKILKKIQINTKHKNAYNTDNTDKKLKKHM